MSSLSNLPAPEDLPGTSEITDGRSLWAWLEAMDTAYGIPVLVASDPEGNQVRVLTEVHMSAYRTESTGEISLVHPDDDDPDEDPLPVAIVLWP